MSHLCFRPPSDATIFAQDPTAVKALLDQLRTSQAWQDTLNSPRIGPEHLRESSATTLEDGQPESRPHSPDSLPPTSVASLLSQLRTSPCNPSPINTPPVPDVCTAHESSHDTPRPSQGLPPTPPHSTPRPVSAAAPAHVQDIRSLSFQQALPHLTRLAVDPSFLSAVSRVRSIYHPCSHSYSHTPSCGKSKTNSNSSCGKNGRPYIRNTRKRSKWLVPSMYVMFPRFLHSKFPILR